MTYENETCAGCVHWADAGDNWHCSFHKQSHMSPGYAQATFTCAPGDRCEHFAPSLQCRQVRALEELTGCVENLGDDVGGAYKDGWG